MELAVPECGGDEPEGGKGIGDTVENGTGKVGAVTCEVVYIYIHIYTVYRRKRAVNKQIIIVIIDRTRV